ncbi:T9SS type A sorting domain-containing protein [Leptobacterium flavescens]|uniref:T9SS type A sorting domain-containing protein n=1 Tax=Leptobacterium flavescens TaxID=472055 RepID=A0A6P0ULT0_9FLAO|nr:T9SS type A sorting domain-containing protein [Leptobacterium flavescens]NER14184.1 T9SS type A sorting domain-containing protein [Leptobacterium flavescens]
MKKLVLIALLVTSYSYGQLYVSNGSYVYVNNQQIFVGDFGNAAADIELQGTASDYTQANNGFIFLRNEGMLFQTTSANSTANIGAGKISLHQEGTADEYDYNYWSSPVHDPQGTNFNTTIGFYDPNSGNDLSPTVATLLAPGAQNGNNSPLQIASKWIYQYAQGTSTAGFTFVGSSDVSGITLAPGTGFTMKGTNGSGSNQQYDFRGRPNTGDINVAVVANDYTLVGNPYPSAMDLQAFLQDADNSEINGEAYFWQQDRTTNSHEITDYVGGYGTYVPIGGSGGEGVFTPATFTDINEDGTADGPGVGTGSNVPRQIIPVSQGFFVFATSTGQVTFKNSHRVFVQESSGNSEFQRIIDDSKFISGTASNTNSTANNTKKGSSIDTPMTYGTTEDETGINPHADNSLLRFNVKIAEDNLIKPMALSFVQGTTDGVDRGADGIDISGLRNNAYWPIEGKNYVIQATTFAADKQIPIGFYVSNQSTFEIAVSQKDNFNENVSIYFYDKESGAAYDITDNSYQITLEAGQYDNRFTIRFLKNPVADDDNDTTGDPVSEDDTAGNDDTTGDEDGDPTDDDVISEDLEDNGPVEFNAFQDNVNKLLTLENPGLTINSVTLYDVAGKILFNDTRNSTDRLITYGTSQYTTGVYIVNVTFADNSIITKKIAINN